MANVDLIFTHAPHGTTLIFGEQEAALAISTATLSASMPDLSAKIVVTPRLSAVPVITMPDMQAQITLAYDVNVSRPTVALVDSGWQAATQVESQISDTWSECNPLRSGTAATWDAADKVRADTAASWVDSTRIRSSARAVHQCATTLPVRPIVAAWQDGTRLRRAAGAVYQSGTARRAAAWSRWQDCTRLRRSIVSDWQEGTLRETPVGQSYQSGTPIKIVVVAAWQAGTVPAPGKWMPSSDTDDDTEYTPSTTLVFERPYSPSTTLIFNWSSDTKTVPVRKAYIVTNDVSLMRVDTSAAVGILSLDISIDAASWVQTWSAEVSHTQYTELLAGYSDTNALELIASVNGHQFYLLAEGAPERDRQFGQTTVRIGGRGVSAWLDDPYATKVTHYNDAAMTAQQLMAQALTYNGVTLGWDIDWQIDDWTVPAGLWSLRGTPIDGVKAVAEAVSAIVQADPYEKLLHVLPYYPSAPWDWDSQTVDIEIPLDIIDVDGVAPVVKPVYNRVYVSGITQGVTGRVTRTGTDGATEADQVSHALITEAVAARQRGLAILGDTGHQARVTISMPISDDTGLIQVGQLAYIPESGDAWRGLVRSVSISAQWSDALKVRQSIQLERHY